MVLEKKLMAISELRIAGVGKDTILPLVSAFFTTNESLTILAWFGVHTNPVDCSTPGFARRILDHLIYLSN